MSVRAAWCGSVLVLLQVLAYGPVAAQGERAGARSMPVDRGGEPLARVQLAGIVLAPDGSPADGAVVVSSAGGRAVTDAAGSYRLEVDVPLEATSVEVTAVGGTGGNLVARTSVAVSATTGRTRVEVLGLARRSPCSSWIPTFGVQPGTNSDVLAFAVYDDGNGPALYAGGAFTAANGVAANRIARWDGSSWTALGSGLNGFVRALTVYDDGSGPALYAGGSFTTAGGVAASRIARWNGSSWSALAGGVSGDVRALAVYDDGSGQALHVGGNFATAGGVQVNDIARWDGSSWSALAGGMDGSFDAIVLALAVYDDGGGPALYAGGGFTSAGGVAANNIAKWDGSSWSALGSGVDGVNALAVYDDGGGPDLYVAGDFLNVDGVAARKIARWNGASWSAVGGRGFQDTEDRVHALVVYDDGGGPDLYAGGEFFSAGGVSVDNVARWDGTTWSALGSGIDEDHSVVTALGVFDAGSGPALHAGGGFTTAGDVGASAIAKWDGASWSALGSGPSGDVHALAVYDDGGGPALYAGGAYFTARTAGGGPANRIARWDGASWSALGTGVNDDVIALAAHDDGSEPALFAGGHFTTAGGVSANHIARWDGSSWSAFGSGVNGWVLALTSFDDGGGPALFAAGYFTTAGGVPANRIAKWDGASWSALGSGVEGNFPVIHALAVCKDGGGGLALFAAGRFTTAGGVAATNIAKWNGASWSALGSGLSLGGVGIVSALAMHDDGRGPALYAGGSFSVAGGVAASAIARWDGSSWSALGSGVNRSISALAVHDDGRGPALFAGGNFVAAGGVAANGIARWDGSSWSALGSGVSGGVFDSSRASVLALAAHDDGTGPALFAGGDFTTATDSGDSFLAKWSCDDSTAPVLSCPSSMTVLDRMGDGPGEVVGFTVTATDDLDSSPVVVCVPPSGSLFPPGTTWVDCTATDASGNQSSRQFPVTVAPKARQR